MGNVQFKDNKVLFSSSNNVAFDSNCCCSSSSSSTCCGQGCANAPSYISHTFADFESCGGGGDPDCIINCNDYLGEYLQPVPTKDANGYCAWTTIEERYHCTVRGNLFYGTIRVSSHLYYGGIFVSLYLDPDSGYTSQKCFDGSASFVPSVDC